jgi:hypothetical protein
MNRICSRTRILCVRGRAQVVYRDIDRARGCNVWGDIGAHSLDGSLDPYALKVIGAHMDEAFPRLRLTKDMVVRDCSEVRSETRDASRDGMRNVIARCRLADRGSKT